MDKMHDTLVYRLSQILVKLNQGEKLLPENLAAEFGVNLRTIQRDLNQRFAYLPLEKEGRYYFLNQAYLGKLSTKDISRFSELAGVAGLFPSRAGELIRDIFDREFQNAILVKGFNYEDMDGLSPNFKMLENAIVERREIAFSYLKRDIKKYSRFQPYRMVNANGIWYLAGIHNGKIKTFSFTKIKDVVFTEVYFNHDENQLSKIVNSEDPWISEEAIEVELVVSSEVAEYFRRRKLLPKQEVEEEYEDGSIRLSSTAGDFKQIAPIIRYWIPHIRVVSPEKLQREVDDSVRAYLNNRENL